MPNSARRPLRAVALVAGAAALATAAVAAPAGAAPARSGSDHARTTLSKQIVPAKGSSAAPRAAGRAAQPAAKRPAGKAASNGISYHGGPLILGTTNVYYIWYGNWATDAAAQPILTDLANNIGGSPYFNINTSYYNGSNTHVTNAVHYAGATTDNYSQGPVLTDPTVQMVVQNAISTGKLPLDTNAVYFVLTSPDVHEATGFGFVYCGWHTNGTINGADIKYSFVGDPATYWMNTCADQSTGPNGGGGGDAMASVVSHELEEAVTDPDLDAWYDSSGNENADKCAWTFDPTYRATNGALANMKLGTRDYLIQRNWVNASGGYCALSF
jgi:archaellum component FlaF (FlaF/FlaG flagellin family)